MFAALLRSWRALLLLVSLSLLLSACASLPEGADSPQLTIESLTLNEQGSTPSFVITYTLEHHSATALPLLSVTADVFVRDTKVATLTKNFSKETLPPNQKVRYQIEVPANLIGAASLDSLRNNSLVMLQGSCALNVRLTPDPKLKQFNPSRSYYGLIGVTQGSHANGI